MDIKQLFDAIDSLGEKYLRVWEDVVNIESPTSSKDGVDAVGEYFAKMAGELGWEVERFRDECAGDALCITANSKATNSPVVFSGHIDTVHPIGLFGYPPSHVEGDYIYGPGVTDCKGGVVSSFMAIEALCSVGFVSRPVRLIIQTDEETSSKNSGWATVRFMCERARGAVAFLNTEGAFGNTAVIRRKGIVRYRITVKGKACHSSMCSKGASAIAEASHKILKLEQYKDESAITCNCGVISGGTTPNTVPAECSFLLDVRFSTQAQYEEAKAAIERIADHSDVDGCTAELEQISFRPAMQYSEKNELLLSKINEIYEESGLPTLNASFAPGGSDAAHVTEAGIPCLDNFGVKGDFIHSADERAYIPSLCESAKKLAAVAFCI